MPTDKWGIPFFYPTARDAGVTGEGSGFFWQQNNNIFKDNDAGMVRLGKEQDDVDVINSSTGEFEFPFDSGADYFCLEVRQGHKTGGEEHGCEGSCYIFNVTINDTPPKFYYQKQLYHGGSKFKDPATGSGFTNSKVTEKVVGSGWKGFAAVIYNKQDGRSSQKDSAILEIWWNEDPVADIDDWFMVKKTEDKGGWGNDGDSCDGDDDQVITWSNIQFRYKSGTPDFSLHPLKPEFEDGPVIHSIGKEDMSFEDSEQRGYGYRADMPANVEMKCLFKFDSNNGICRLKNLSLREIDATKSFDDDPDQPTEGPQETQTIQGKFKLQWDLNTTRASSCAGSGLEAFYNYPATSEKAIGQTENTTKVAQQVFSVSSIRNKVPLQLVVPLMKVGSVAASPTVSAKIWDSSGAVVYTSPTTFDPSTFTTSYVNKTFSFSTNTRSLVTGDRIGIEYTGGVEDDYSSYVACSFAPGTEGDGDYAHYWSGTWSTKGERNFSCIMYE